MTSPMTPPTPLPYATPDVPGVGGTLRNRPEDFFVQEIPLYEPAGEGTHIHFEVQKTGLTTRETINRIARALDVPPRDIGYAGLKDRHALTRQLFSVSSEGTGVDEEKVMMMQTGDIVPQWAARHGNKLKIGHLSGNRFAIRIRDVNPTDVLRLRPVLDRLAERGLPNYYGEQRFGADAARPTDALGLALIRQDWQGFCDRFLGGEDTREDVAAARRRYDAGDREGALEIWPRNIATERRVLEKLVRTGDARKAAMTIDRKMRQFYASAAQSALFNAVVAHRVTDGTLATMLPGDVAVKHLDNLHTGGMFVVEDPSTEQPRADAWEISPTGPMPGRKMKSPAGDALMIEQAVAAELGISPGDFDSETGARRPLRVKPADTTLAAGTDEDGPHITVAFTLPAGSFATVLLRELMKN